MKHCFFFLLDGARYDVFHNLLQSNKLPHIKKYFLNQGELKKGLTSFPSTTGPAYLPFLTGKHPGECNVPGIRWLDKKEFKKGGLSLFKYRSYVGLGSYLINRDMNPQVKTLFHHFPHSFNIYNTITSGLREKNNKEKWTKIYSSSYSHFTSNWFWVDERTKQAFLKLLPQKPQFVFAVFPSVDGISHMEGPFSKKTLEAYEKIDTHIGSILEKHIELNDPHFENTLIIISSDHGMSETHTHFDVASFLETKKNKVFSYPQVWKKNVDSAVMVSGNAMAHLYFLDSEEPLLYQNFKEKHKYVVDLLFEQDAIEWIAARRGEKDFFITKKNVHENDIIDLEYQLSHIFKSPRSGDLIVAAKRGFDLRKDFEIPEHRGSHGALLKEHMEIPICINKRFERDLYRNLDVFSCIKDYLEEKVI